MTDRTALLMDLAERCEKADGADWNLSADIARAMGWAEGEHAWHSLDWRSRQSGPPHYTNSLDAALSLVPEGWRWSLDHTQKPPYRDCGMATLYAPGDGWTPADVSEIYGATPALALCAAALRALASGASR